jgi:hypothetical protein
VRRAQQAPLASNFFDSSQQELAEAARKFDVSKDRLYGLLAQPITAAVACFF